MIGDNGEWLRSKRFEIFKLCVKAKLSVFSPKQSKSSFLILALQFLNVIFPVILNGIERESSTVKINEDDAIPFHWALTVVMRRPTSKLTRRRSAQRGRDPKSVAFGRIRLNERLGAFKEHPDKFPSFVTETHELPSSNS